QGCQYHDLSIVSPYVYSNGKTRQPDKNIKDISCIFSDLHHNILNLKELNANKFFKYQHVDPSLKIPFHQLFHIIKDNFSPATSNSATMRCLSTNVNTAFISQFNFDNLPLFNSPLFTSDDSHSSPLEISLNTRSWVKKIFSAKRFSSLLSLTRWNRIEFFHTKQLIDWSFTWSLFSFHLGLNNQATSFKYSSQISFS